MLLQVERPNYYFFDEPGRNHSAESTTKKFARENVTVRPSESQLANHRQQFAERTGARSTIKIQPVNSPNNIAQTWPKTNIVFFLSALWLSSITPQWEFLSFFCFFFCFLSLIHSDTLVFYFEKDFFTRY